MSDNPYSRYAYKRKRKRRPIFLIVAAVLLAVIILFTANLVFGFMNLGGSSSGSATLRGVNVWAVHSENYSTKAEASERAFQIKQNGGAGFVIEADASWIVLENAYITKTDAEREQKQYLIREFSAPELKITLNDKTHKNALTAVTDSFITNFEFFNEYLNKVRIGTAEAKEVSYAALEKYNVLQSAVEMLDKIQEDARDPFYTKVLLAANKQLLALYLLSGNAANTNFKSDIASCICNTIFAYIELINL